VAGLLEPGQMYKPLTVIAVALAAMPACVNISATNDRYVEREEQRFQVTGAPDLTLETFDGSIQVNTWTRPEVLVVIEKHAGDRDLFGRIHVTREQRDNVIRLDVRDDDANYQNSLAFSNFRRARLVVTVPEASTVRARTSDGAITIRDIEGTIEADTGDGVIRLDQVQGDVNARSGDGRIIVSGRLSRVRARSGDGSITVHAGDGSVTSADWDLATGDGAVTLEVPDNFSAELDARTGDGRITVRNRDSQGSRNPSPRGRLRTTLNGGGHTVHIRTDDGAIIVRGS
jgi:hypothetical protein